MAELLGKVFSYRSAIYAEFERKEQCSYEANVELQILCTFCLILILFW